MPKITYLRDGHARTADVPVGTSVMRGAVTNDIDGIVAMCGGHMQCATCHVRVDPERAAALPPRSAAEDAMLDFTAVPRTAHSRLSCQLTVTEEMDGLTVHLPERQLP